MSCNKIELKSDPLKDEHTICSEKTDHNYTMETSPVGNKRELFVPNAPA